MPQTSRRRPRRRFFFLGSEEEFWLFDIDLLPPSIQPDYTIGGTWRIGIATSTSPLIQEWLPNSPGESLSVWIGYQQRSLAFFRFFGEIVTLPAKMTNIG